MTGVERLQGMSMAFRGYTWGASLSEALGDIAEQIKREMQTSSEVEKKKCDPVDVSMSAYDLLPEDEREAVAWVREHGGIAYVKDAWNVRSNLDRQLEKAQAKVERQQRHIEFVQRKCRERQERIAALNKTVAEMRPRLMPEGMEWPRYEDGEPVRVGDEVLDEAEELVYRISEIAFSDGYGTCLRYEDQRDGNSYNFIDGLESGQCVKRPAPKVLDADGVGIRVGDTVWHVETGEQCKVVEVDSRSVSVDFRVDGDGTKHTGSILPTNLTHRASVLAADGRPLRKGEHVYHVETGTELVVKKLPKPGEYQAVIVFALPTSPASHLTTFDPDQLTHERPDSWERLEKDVAGASCPDVYCANHHIDASDTSYEWAMARDIVRRAKALAERSE